MNRVFYCLFFAGFLFLHLDCRAQNLTDTLTIKDTGRNKGHKTEPYRVDSFSRRLHDPRKATIRSAIIPGWGQIYNRKYWKLPLVYAAVGIPAYFYFDNRTWYRNCQHAITVLANYQASLPPGTPGGPVPDSVVRMVNIKLQPLVASGDDNDLRTYRNEYRKDEDYSVLFFLLFWGLNVVDATVDAHLMYFDVSNNLSMQLQM